MKLTTKQIKTRVLESKCKDYARLKEEAEKLASEMDAIKEEILVGMVELDKKNVGIDEGDFVFIDEHSRMQVDKGKLEKFYPNVYRKVIKESTVNPTVRYKKSK